MTIREFFDREIFYTANVTALDHLYARMDALFEAYENETPAWEDFILAHRIDVISPYGLHDLEVWVRELRLA